jgi:peptidoglycan/LPS O-acetylase OafA/YrhL
VQSDAARAANPYRPDIDGLRALAVTTVVLFHAGLTTLPGGFVGVDIFFVISGFLIGGIVSDAVSRGEFSFANFYARRAKRIVPALLAVLVSCLILGLAMLGAEEMTDLSAATVVSVFGLSNFYFWRNTSYFNPDAEFDPLLMTWSLGVEEQFYVFAPILLILMRSWRAGTRLGAIVALCAVSLVISVVASTLWPRAAFYLLPTRAWELGAGVALALIRDDAIQKAKRHREWLSIAGLGLILISVLLFSSKINWPGFYAIFPVLGTLALLLSKDSFLNCRVLGSKPFVAIGLVSYSWYLWHWPLLVFLRIATAGNPSIWSIAGVVLLSLVLAIGSWRFIERPFRQARTADTRTLKQYGVAMATVTLVGIGAWQSASIVEQARPQSARIEAEIANFREYECMTSASQFRRSRNCGSHEGGEPTLALIGDSHAGALGRSLFEAAGKNGTTAAVLTKHACSPSYGVSIHKLDDPKFFASCRAFLKDSLAYVVESESIGTVLLAGLWTVGNSEAPLLKWEGEAPESGRHLLSEGLTRAIEVLQAAGKRVILVEDTPYWRMDPARASMSRLNPLRSAIFSNAVAGGRVVPGVGESLPVNLEAKIVRHAALRAGAEYMPTRHVFCRGDHDSLCLFETELGKPLFNDRSHLSKIGADLVISANEQRIFGNRDGRYQAHLE